MIRRWLSEIRRDLSPDSLAERIDDLTSDLRRSTGQPPSPRIERRRAARRVKRG